MRRGQSMASTSGEDRARDALYQNECHRSLMTADGFDLDVLLKLDSMTLSPALYIKGERDASCADLAGAGSRFDPKARRSSEFCELDSMPCDTKGATGPVSWLCQWQPGRDDTPNVGPGQNDEFSHLPSLCAESTVKTEDFSDPGRLPCSNLSNTSKTCKHSQILVSERKAFPIASTTANTSVIPNEFQDPGISEALMIRTEHANEYRGHPSAQAAVSCAGANQGQLNDARDFASHNKHSEKSGEEPGTSRKKKRSPAENHEKDDGDDEDPGSLARPPKKKLKIETSRRAYACPFVKRDPFNHQECLGLKLGKFSYVKQHLLRSHFAETCCPRCGQKFPGENSTTEYNKHLKQENICERRNFSLDGKMPSDVRDKVMDEKRRKHENGRKLEDKERWHRVYQILFPGAERPQSPYAETPAVEILQAFSTSMRQDIGSKILKQVAHGRSHEECIQLLEGVVSFFVRHLHENYGSPSARDLSPVSGDEPSTAGSSTHVTDKGPTSSQGAFLGPSPTSTPLSHDISGSPLSTLDSSSSEGTASGTGPEVSPTAAITDLSSGASLSPPVEAFSSSVSSETEMSAMEWWPAWPPQGMGDLGTTNSRLEQELGLAFTGQRVNTPINSTQGASAYSLGLFDSGHEVRAATFDFVSPNSSWNTHAAGPMGQLWMTALDPSVYSPFHSTSIFPEGIGQIYGGTPPKSTLG